MAGTVNLIEFVASTMEPQLFCEPRLCKAAFRVIDADHDGYITQAGILRRPTILHLAQAESGHPSHATWQADLEAMLMEGPKRASNAKAILESAARPERAD